MAKKKATGKKKTTRRKKNVPTPEELWQQAQEEIDIGSPMGYSMTSSYVAGVAIEHPKFGLGVITEVMPTKISVVFKDGAKFLVHNRSI